VIDKPSGVLSVPGRGEAPFVAQILREMGTIRPNEELRVVHRLDRGASGVMVLARTLDAQRNLSAQWHARTVEKTYLALVSGRMENAGEIDLPLYVDRDKGRVKVDRRRGKPSVTRYRVIERLAGQTVLECVPVTGRLHQIRVHLAAIEHPLLVDTLYGGSRCVRLSTYKAGYRPKRDGVERPLIERLTLHALRIRFQHPSSAADVTFEASIPKDLRATINQLRRVAASP